MILNKTKAEHTNACIGKAFVDDGPIKHQYFSLLDEKSQDELYNMTIDEILQVEEECIQKNVLKVAEDLCSRVHMEPGPAGDLMIGMLTDKQKHQFFYNNDYLKMYRKASKKKKKECPGYYYLLQNPEIHR